MKDAAIEAVLDRLALRMNMEGAVRPRHRHGEEGPRHRGRLQGLDLADHLDRDRQCRGRRQRHALLQHRRHGAGLRHRQCAVRGRGAQRSGRVGEGRASRHRRDALRHGDARLALALSHGQCGAARGRGRQGEARGAGARGRRAGRLERAGRRAVREEIQDAGRQHHRHRQLHPELRAAGRQRADARRDAVLDGRRHRRRGRGRHRDRARAR